MTHPDWPAFLAAIVADPDDDTVRLVAADFLDENGHADRAAFIRVQVALARLEAPGSGESPEAGVSRPEVGVPAPVGRGFVGGVVTSGSSRDRPGAGQSPFAKVPGPLPAGRGSIGTLSSSILKVADHSSAIGMKLAGGALGTRGIGATGTGTGADTAGVVVPVPAFARFHAVTSADTTSTAFSN